MTAVDARRTQSVDTTHNAQGARGSLDRAGKRLLDVTAAVGMLCLLAPLIFLIAVAIKLDSRGPVFYRCKRVGSRGATLWMLKFRKMRDDARGPALTVARDDRFTRLGRFLAKTKLDEVPQLWNVLKGEMSLVGPRPEDAQFVSLHSLDYEEILSVKPGITGLCQLAFANESDILDSSNPVAFYVDNLLPQKVSLDRLYAARRTLVMDCRILAWTVAAVILRRDVAVHRDNGRMGFRRRSTVPADVVNSETPNVTATPR